MDPTETIPIPVLGEQGEPCEGCGSPLAADQRYCLNCGQRRAGPRVEYRQHLGAPESSDPPVEPAQAAAKAAAPEPQKRERDYAPFAAVGGIAVLGLMLLVGVLIGKGNNTTASAPAPIIKYSGEAPGSGSTASAEPEESKPKAPKKANGGSSSKTGATKVKGGLTGSAANNSAQPVEASTDDLENLDNQSGEEYEKSIEKLPDKIATPGKAPPIDTSKAPGGGGAAESIE